MDELLGPYLSALVQTHALDLDHCGKLVCCADVLDPGLPGLRDLANQQRG